MEPRHRVYNVFGDFILLAVLCTENKCKALGEQVTTEGPIPFILFLSFLFQTLIVALQSLLLAAVPETGESVAGGVLLILFLKK